MVQPIGDLPQPTPIYKAKESSVVELAHHLSRDIEEFTRMIRTLTPDLAQDPKFLSQFAQLIKRLNVDSKKAGNL